MIHTPLVDWRFDPFSGTLQAVAVTEKKYIPTSSPYWVRLKEVPKQDSPSTVQVYCVDDSAYFTEVLTSPAQGQFRVDYQYNTGLIEFNSADAGKQVNITYQGLGAIVLAKQVESYLHPFDIRRNLRSWNHSAVYISTSWMDIGGPEEGMFLSPHIYNKEKIGIKFRTKLTAQDSDGTNNFYFRLKMIFSFPSGSTLTLYSDEYSFSAGYPATTVYHTFIIDIADLADHSEHGFGDNQIIYIPYQFVSQCMVSTSPTNTSATSESDPSYTQPISLEYN